MASKTPLRPKIVATAKVATGDMLLLPTVAICLNAIQRTMLNGVIITQ
jgi:hypothetical protein